MIGIVADDFNLLLKKNDSILEEVVSDFSKLKNSCLSLSSNLNSDDLKFINNKFNLEVKQLDNALNKLYGYQKTLKNVYNGYQKQYEQFVIDSKKLIS